MSQPARTIVSSPSQTTRPVPRRMRQCLLILPGLISLLTLLSGCGATKVSDRDLSFVEVRDAYVMSQGKTGVFGLGSSKPAWIDPRPQSAFAEGHIPGALNIPLQTIEADDPRLEEYNVFIVYGEDYNSPLANAMAKKMLAMEYKDVRIMRGGLNAWKQAGNDVEQ